MLNMLGIALTYDVGKVPVTLGRSPRSRYR